MTQGPIRFFRSDKKANIEELTPTARRKIEAWLRTGSDNLYEILVRSSEGDRLYVLPYAFSCKDSARQWLHSIKGRKVLNTMTTHDDVCLTTAAVRNAEPL